DQQGLLNPLRRERAERHHKDHVLVGQPVRLRKKWTAARTTATISSRWISPAASLNATVPSSQRTSRIAAIFSSMSSDFLPASKTLEDSVHGQCDRGAACDGIAGQPARGAVFGGDGDPV